jgi:hypothetical protein
MVGGFHRPLTNLWRIFFLKDDKMRTCVVCGKSYSFCPRCDKDRNKPLFHFTFCSSKCRDIYDIASKFEDKKIDKKEAKEQLGFLEPIEISTLRGCYKDCIGKIYTDDEDMNAEVIETSVPVEDVVKPKRKTRKTTKKE